VPTTEPLFLADAYQRAATGRVAAVNERGGIVLDRTVFYATGGGQPGDRGILRHSGSEIVIATAVKGQTPGEIVHVPAAGATDAMPAPGDEIEAVIDWELRHRRMRIHTALHLLSVAMPFPVTGGQIADDYGRLDFDVDGTMPDREELTARLQALIDGDHAVSSEWITDTELDANPGLVKTMRVQPPRGSGRVRLVRIGEVDLQPCGGTHVARTGEIGPMTVSRIESKGARNKRVRIAFADGA
jgi:misacylated tRNA(Ala) deacylase